MTSVLPDDGNKAAKTKQKLTNDGHAKEETRSFLSFSRENLSISHSDLEQGFNRHRFRANKNTILSTAALLIALVCFGLETWKLHRSLVNSREIEGLKRDVESLKHRFLEEDLLDELKALKEQLYVEESSEGDPGEADIDNADYESNYDDDVSHDYSDDYQAPAYGSRPSDFPDSASTIRPVPSPPDPCSTEALLEFLAAVREVDARRGREKINEAPANNSTKRKRDISEESVSETPGRRPGRRVVGRLRSRGNFEEREPSRHPPKKYYAHAHPENPHALPSDDLTSEIVRSNEDAANDGGRRFNWSQSDSGMIEFPETLRAPSSSSAKVYAVHYEADSLLFSADDEHTGNGRARHGDGIFKAWRPSDWVNDLGMQRHFALAGDGRLTVHEPGLYLAYAQIHYLDEHDENGFHLLVNGRPILQCMIYSPGNGHKSRSCFSAQVTFLRAADVLILKDVGSARYTLFQHDKSFFGLAKLGEPRQPPRQQHSTQPPQQ